jgi:hypothetical protein
MLALSPTWFTDNKTKERNAKVAPCFTGPQLSMSSGIKIEIVARKMNHCDVDTTIMWSLHLNLSPLLPPLYLSVYAHIAHMEACNPYIYSI